MRRGGPGILVSCPRNSRYIAGGQLAVFQGGPSRTGGKAPISGSYGSIRRGGGKTANCPGPRVAMKMGRLGGTYRRVGVSAFAKRRQLCRDLLVITAVSKNGLAPPAADTPIRRPASAGTTVVVRPGAALSVRTREIGARQTSRISKIADELRNSLHFYADRLDLGVELNCFSTHFATPT
jgi:hypothetical protein